MEWPALLLIVGVVGVAAFFIVGLRGSFREEDGSGGISATIIGGTDERGDHEHGHGGGHGHDHGSSEGSWGGDSGEGSDSGGDGGGGGGGD